jgi:hypothetical protein
MVEGSNNFLKDPDFLYVPSRKMARSERIPSWLFEFSLRQRRGLVLSALQLIFEAARASDPRKVARIYNGVLLPLILKDSKPYEVRIHKNKHRWWV